MQYKYKFCYIICKYMFHPWIFFLFEKYDILQIVLNEMSDLFPITWVDPVNKLVTKFVTITNV